MTGAPAGPDPAFGQRVGADAAGLLDDVRLRTGFGRLGLAVHRASIGPHPSERQPAEVRTVGSSQGGALLPLVPDVAARVPVPLPSVTFAARSKA